MKNYFITKLKRLQSYLNIAYLLKARNTITESLLAYIQKHIIVVYDKGENAYYAIGYLTSKSSAEPFADQQFNTYQDSKEANKDPSMILKGKPQNITFHKNFISIDKNQLTFLKWDQDYFKDMGPNVFGQFNTVVKALKNEPMRFYDPKGYPRGVLVQACIRFDYRVKNKIPHPKTDDQILNEKVINDHKEAFMKEKALKKAKDKELYAHFKVKSITPFDE